MSKVQDELEKKTQNAIIQAAFLRWESAVVIAGTLLLMVFGGNIVEFVPAWGWFLSGLLAEAGLVYSSMSDPEFGRQVVAELLRTKFKPERLKDKKLQRQINEALDYRSRIEKAIREQDDSILKDEFNQTASQIDDWLENIYDLARRIDRQQQEKVILERDRKRTRSRINQLNQQLQTESNQSIVQQIESTLESMKRQLATLDTLDETLRRARLQLENSLVHLGTIYSQTMLVDVKDIDSGRAKRLRQEISEEVTELGDILIAMDEVYSSESSI